MPSKDEHRKQAEHNLACYQSLDSSTYPDWAVTVLFYTALHYIDAFLAKKNIHPMSHDIRDKYVNQLVELKIIYFHYAFLKNHSRTARYVPPTSFSSSEIQDLETIHLASIRTALQSHIN